MSTGAGTIAETQVPATGRTNVRWWGEDLVAHAGRGDMPRRIAAELRDKIRLGELRPGDQLPSEEALAEQYGVSRTPARNALLMLKTEGRLEARPQAGYVVRLWTPKPVNPALATGGGRETGAEVSVRSIVPSGRVAELLPGETDVVCRTASGSAVTSSYYSARAVAAVPEIGRAAPLGEPDVVLLGRAGLVTVRSREQVRAFPPAPEEQELLRVSPETPLLEHSAVLLDKEGRPLLARVRLLAADRNFLEWEGTV